MAAGRGATAGPRRVHELSSGTGAGGVTGSGPAAVAGLRTIRHVWVIDLENQGYAQTFGNPSADPYLARTLPRMGALAGELLRDRPQQRGQLHRPGLRAGPGPGHPGRLPALDTVPGRHGGRAVSPGPRRGLRLPGDRADARQPAVGCRAGLGGLPAGHGQRPGPRPHGQPRRGDPPAATLPPGPSTVPSAPSGPTSTPPAMTDSRSSGRSPGTGPSAPRTSCRSGRCRGTWPAPARHRRSLSSCRTCAMTVTTRPA